MVVLKCVAAWMLGVAVATAAAAPLKAAGEPTGVDVTGLECRLDFETTRDEQVLPPEKISYLYLVLQAPKEKRDAIDSVLQFVADKADPEVLITPYYGTTAVAKDGRLIFRSRQETVEEQFSFALDLKALRMTTFQARNRDYYLVDTVSNIFKTQGKWPELKGDVPAAPSEAPNFQFDALAQYLMRLDCRKVDAAQLRRIAAARAAH